MARQLGRVREDFPQAEFVANAAQKLETLELKERSAQIQKAFTDWAPGTFSERCALIVAALHPEEFANYFAPEWSEEGLTSWSLMPLADFLGNEGRDEPKLALASLRELTKRFTAEFAIRPLLAQDAQGVLAELKRWLSDPNHHVRRLISEGTRPRLPWGMQLREFVQSPAPLLPLLTALRDDPSDYVRRSVANNLNDISKDHPELVASVARDWLAGAGRERTRLVRHACRTLLKKGHPPTLAVFGYEPPVLDNVILETPREVVIGEEFAFAVAFQSSDSRLQKLMVDYEVSYQKAGGRQSGKVFKGTKVDLTAGEAFRWRKSHSFQPVTVRRLYPGAHAITILVNGLAVATGEFMLLAG